MRGTCHLSHHRIPLLNPFNTKMRNVLSPKNFLVTFPTLFGIYSRNDKTTALGAAEPQPRIDPSSEHCLSPSTRLRIDSASCAAILTCPGQSRRIRGGGEGTRRACPHGGGGRAEAKMVWVLLPKQKACPELVEGTSSCGGRNPAYKKMIILKSLGLRNWFKKQG